MLDLPELIDPHPQDEPGGWEAPGGGVVVVGRGWWTRLDRRLREPATAKELAHAVVSLLLGPLDLVILFLLPTTVVVLLLSPLVIAAGEGPVGAVVWTVETRAEAWLALAVGLVAVPPCCHTVTLAARAHAVLARALLAPRGAELAARVRELTRSRLRLVDAFDVERRRIERDLHDGAQQHLVAMVMTLDLAGIELEALEGTAHAAAADLVAQAHAQARRMMVELRELIRAIHPQLLVERGLGPALEELADRSPVAARCVVDVPQRPPPPVETTAYFVVAEALANTAKHSGAERAEIGVWTTGDRLVVQVRDDGCGGADADQGTGLRGLGDRVSALDGELTLWSPVGGPTVVRASLPLVIQPAGGAV
jgi:signal transduction histidine kinase